MDFKTLFRKIRRRVCGCKLVVIDAQGSQVLVLDRNKNVGCLEGEAFDVVMKPGVIIWAFSGGDMSLFKVSPGSYKNKDQSARLLYYDEKRHMWIARLKYDTSLAFFDADYHRYQPGDTVVVDFFGQKALISRFVM